MLDKYDAKGHLPLLKSINGQAFFGHGENVEVETWAAVSFSLSFCSHTGGKPRDHGIIDGAPRPGACHCRCYNGESGRRERTAIRQGATPNLTCATFSTMLRARAHFDSDSIERFG